MKRIHIRTCRYRYNACCCSNICWWNETTQQTDFQRQNMQRKKPWEGGMAWVSMKTVLLLTFSSSSYSETLRSSALFSCGKKWHTWATTTYVLDKSHQLYCQHIQIQTCCLFCQGIPWNKSQLFLSLKIKLLLDFTQVLLPQFLQYYNHWYQMME